MTTPVRIVSPLPSAPARATVPPAQFRRSSPVQAYVVAGTTVYATSAAMAVALYLS